MVFVLTGAGQRVVLGLHVRELGIIKAKGLEIGQTPIGFPRRRFGSNGTQINRYCLLTLATIAQRVPVAGQDTFVIGRPLKGLGKLTMSQLKSARHGERCGELHLMRQIVGLLLPQQPVLGQCLIKALVPGKRGHVIGTGDMEARGQLETPLQQ